MSKKIKNTQSLSAVSSDQINVSANIDQRIEAEQIRHIYQQTPVFVPAVFIGSTLSTIMLWPATTPLVAVSWCVIIWIIYSGLWMLCKRWQRVQPDDLSMRYWAKPFILMAWLATAAWGSAGIIFFMQIH